MPLACGVSRVMSLSRPDTVGSVAISARLTDVAAPVRARAEDDVGDRRDRDRLADGDGLHVEVQVGGDAEVDVDVFLRLGFEGGSSAAVGDGDRVGTADAHAENGEASIGARRGFVGGARRQVNRDHFRARNGQLLRIGDHTGDISCGDALCVGPIGRPQQHAHGEKGQATPPGGAATLTSVLSHRRVLSKRSHANAAGPRKTHRRYHSGAGTAE